MVFDKRGKDKYPQKNLSEQCSEPINSTPILWNQTLATLVAVLLPLSHLCSLKGIIIIIIKIIEIKIIKLIFKYKILWDFMVQYDYEIEHRKPVILVVDKNNKQCRIIDVTNHATKKVCDKGREKNERYEN